MGIKVLLAQDSSVQLDSYAQKTFSSPLLPDHYYVQFDFRIPSATLAAIVGDGGNFTADILEIENFEGLFLITSDAGAHWTYGTDRGSGSHAYTDDDHWHTALFEFTWNSFGATTAQLSIDSAVIFATYVLSPAVTTGAFHTPEMHLGGDLGWGVTGGGENYYIDNVKVGTTPGGTDIFCSDFESGDFSDWTSTNGVVSVVNDPLGTGGPSTGCGGGGTPVTCEDAVTLTPDCAETTIDNSTVGTTEEASDPLNTVYGLGAAERQLWFKFTNDTADTQYARFTLHNPGAASVSVIGGLFLECPATTDLTQWPWITNGGFYSIANVDNVTFGELIPAGDDSITALGVVLPAGATVWVELGSSDPSHPWAGDLVLIWKLLTVSFSDTTDTEKPGTTDTIAPWDSTPLGQSETLPANTALDYTGFSPFTGSGTEGETSVLDSIFHAGHFYTCAVRATDDGAVSGGRLQKMELGVWQIDPDGTIASFTIVDTLINRWQHDVGQEDYGSGFMDHQNLDFAGKGAAIFASDGTNLWLAIRVREPQLNPWDPSIPKHPWNVGHVVVYSLSGGWARIGSVDPKTTNALNSDGGAPTSGGAYSFDAHASGDAVGQLLVVMSERGATSAWSDAGDGGDNAVHGETPPGWITRTVVAAFGAGGGISQTDLFSTHTLLSDPNVAGPQDAMGEFVWVRSNAFGSLFVWLVPRTDGTSGYQDAAAIYTIAGSLAATIDSVLIDPILGTGNLSDGWLASNAVTDVGYDSADVYFLGLLKSITTGIFRIPLANPAAASYFDAAPGRSAAPEITGSAGSVYCDAHSTWLVGNDILRFDRCSDEWGILSESYFSTTPGDEYPSLEMESQHAHFDGEYLYNSGTYVSAGGIRAASFNQTHLLRQFLICRVGDCVAIGPVFVNRRVGFNDDPPVAATGVYMARRVLFGEDTADPGGSGVHVAERFLFG